MLNRHSFLILIFALTFPISGQVAGQIAEEIVVTASALPETVEATPAAVSVLTREEIDRRAVRDVADALREVPGIQMSRTGSPGRATSLFTRGSNSNHTLVLWNGIEITNPYFSGYDWGRFSTAGVEQVEIVRGPYSALYGSDAVAGVVNVLTTSRRSGFRALLEGGQHGLRNGSATASYAGPAFHLSGSFETREDDGFAPNDDFAQDSGSVLIRWNMLSSLSVGLSARQTSYELGVPTNLNFFGDAIVPSLLRRQDGRERQIAIPIEQVLGRFSYDLTLAESRRSDDFEDPEDPYGLVSTSTESETRRARLTTRTETAFGTIVAGGEYEHAEVDDLTNFGPNFTGGERSEKSLFVEDRLTRALTADSRVEISAGVRWDHYETFGSELSPRVSAAWIRGDHKVRAAFGEAFRAPAIGELYFPFMGNPDLEAERSRSFEVGYDHGLGLAVTLFRNDFEDLIVFDNATNRFGNVGGASSQGLELALQRDLTSSFHTAASYTFTDTEEEGADRPLVRRPRNSGSVHLGYRTGVLHANLVAIYTGARADILPIFPFSRTTNEAHTTFDANLQVPLGRFTPYVKVENLTDVEYEEVLGFPSASRRFVAGVRFGM